MNGNDLLVGFNNISDELVAETLTNKVAIPFTRLILPLAASVAVVVATFSLWPKYDIENDIAMTPPGISSAESAQEKKEYTLDFNRSNSEIARSVFIKGHFYKELTVERAEKILPALANKYQIKGRVNYSHHEEVTSIVNVDTKFKLGDNDMKLTMSPGEIPKCYVISGEPIFSEIEGIKIDAGVFITDKNSRGIVNYIYYADFKIDDISYYAEYSGKKEDEKIFTDIIAEIILNGKADFSSVENPVVPKLRDESLTESEAFFEADFGGYLPRITDGYTLNSATRFINQDRDDLYASWSQNYNDISFRVSRIKEQDKKRMVTKEDSELYDISLYPIPWGDSMSYETYEIVSNPIFKAEELTLDMVKKREYIRGEEGDSSKNSVSMRFCVLYGDVVLEVMTEDVEAEKLYKELIKLPYR